MKNLSIYGITVLVFLIIDGIWLGFISKDLYSSKLGHLMAEKVNILPALIFYLLFALAIVIIAIIPGLNDSDLKKTLFLAAVLGFISYATYDLTNYATLKDWPLSIVIIDIIWGTFLTTSTAALSYYLINLFNI